MARVAAIMIELQNITVRYRKKAVVDNLSASCKSGEFIALIGPNGSGKSSLLKAIAGLVPFEGTSSLPLGRRDRAKRIAYLAQNSTAPEERFVEDIIALGRTPFLGPLAKLSAVDKTAIEAAAKACETKQFFGQKFGTLSGGEKMRVHLSRTLSGQCPIVLADEPTAALDPYYQLSILDILKQATHAGSTAIVALHDLKLAERYADQIWVMHRGKLVAKGAAKTALSDAILRDVFRITRSGNLIE